MLERSLRVSQRFRASAITSVHILFALLDAGDATVIRTLNTAGVNPAALAAAAKARLDDEAAVPSAHAVAADPDHLDRIEATLADVVTRLDRIERLLGGESAGQG